MFLCNLSIAQKSHNITIQIKTKGLSDSSIVYIVGNHEEFGKWRPNKVSLNKESKDDWIKSFEFRKGTSLEFKFTLGSWGTEALNNEKLVPANHTLEVLSDTTIIFNINYWKDEFDQKNNYKGQITGTVKYHKNLKWQGIKERDIIVWLPPGYNENIDKKYPVLYMHDGQNIIDPQTSSFGIDWQIDEAADSLIKQNAIEPLIIVGIYNTDERMSEYTYSDTGYVYMDFVINGVKPLIDKTYRTKPGREYTVTGGSSAGGLISFMLAWEYPEIFSKAICMSPALKVRHLDYVSKVLEYEGEKKDIKLYLDNGGIALEKELQPGIYEMIGVLATKGYELNKDLFWIKDEDAQHTESAWANRIPNTVKLFYGK